MYIYNDDIYAETCMHVSKFAAGCVVDAMPTIDADPLTIDLIALAVQV
jgi:hypothetical protein